MIRRPISFGAVLLIVILYVGSYFGVSETVPQSFLSEGSRIQLMGRVKSRERTGYGIRLYLEECRILPTVSNHSDETSYKNSFKQSELQINENLKLKENSRSEQDFNLEQNPRSEQNFNLKQSRQILVYLQEEGESPEKISVGNWILAEGIYSSFENAANPGQFDQADYYGARGIWGMLKKGTLVRQWRQSTYGGILERIRNTLQDSMERVLGEEKAAVTAAITLGIREGLSEEMKTLYQEGGIAHILAISSLHITLIGRSVYQLLRKFRVSLAASSLISGGLLFSFCVMTGMSVSARRACIMYLMWLGSQIFGRTNDPLTALGLASFVILLPSPGYLRDSSFLLSFGCLLSIEYVRPLMKVLFPIPGALGGSLHTSMAVQLGTLPLIMMFFYQVTPYGVLVNLAVLPLMGLLMVSGLASAVIGLVSLPAGVVAAAPCHYLLAGFEWLCRMERKLPGAVVITGCPKAWQVILYYVILFLLCRPLVRWQNQWKKQVRLQKPQAERRWKERMPGRIGLVGMTLAVGLLGLRISPELRLVFLDVGQGDGILVQSGEFCCVIDGGSSSESKVWKYRMESALKYYGIDQLDAVFVSHGDQDHISGIRELLEGYEAGWDGRNIGGITVERLILPDLGYQEERLSELGNLAEKKEIPVGILVRGGSLESGGLRITCLAPNRGTVTGDANQDSMVLLLEYREFKALFTGDMEQEGEERLLENTVSEEALFGENADLEAKEDFQGNMDLPGEIEVLKVAHHGSGNGTSAAFLERIRPKLAVISCGEDNTYGHPAQEVLERLEAQQTQVFRTDKNGAVVVEVKNGKWKATGYCEQ